MKKFRGLLLLAALAALSVTSLAQMTSRIIPETVPTTLKSGTILTVAARLYSVPTGGTPVFSESEGSLKVTVSSSLIFHLG